MAFMALLRKHAAFLIMLLVAAPLMLSFAIQDGIATIGDDSVSYLTLARHYAGSIGAPLMPWVRFQDHFPPLFPLALAATGGAENLRVAHAVVALFAIMGLAMVYSYGMLRFARRGPALALVAVFLVTPSAWISIKGILSDSLYLFVSLAAICLYEWRLAREPRSRTAEWAVLGFLLAAAWLSRAAGSVLVIAYALHAVLRMAREPRTPRWRRALPLLVFAAAAGAWIAVRASNGSNEYQRYIGGMLQAWSDDPALFLRISARTMTDAWISSFAADADVSLAPKIVIALVGLLAVAGAIRRALGNHLDGWYVLGSLAVLSFYVIDENDTRRVLYPILPLLLAHAAGLAIDLTDRIPGFRHPNLALAAIGLAPALVCLPASILIALKATDTTPFFAGGHAAADITDYYTTINRTRARAIAAREAAVLDGLGRLRLATPGDARIMWVRPEYVALLGERQAVPFYFEWNARELAEAIQASQASDVVLATLFKSDLHNKRADPLPIMKTAGAYAEPVYSMRNAVTGNEEFVLLKIDRQRLADYLAR